MFNVNTDIMERLKKVAILDWAVIMQDRYQPSQAQIVASHLTNSHIWIEYGALNWHENYDYYYESVCRLCDQLLDAEDKRAYDEKFSEWQQDYATDMDEQLLKTLQQLLDSGELKKLIVNPARIHGVFNQRWYTVFTSIYLYAKELKFSSLEEGLKKPKPVSHGDAAWYIAYYLTLGANSCNSNEIASLIHFEKQLLDWLTETFFEEYEPMQNNVEVSDLQRKACFRAKILASHDYLALILEHLTLELMQKLKLTYPDTFKQTLVNYRNDQEWFIYVDWFPFTHIDAFDTELRYCHAMYHDAKQKESYATLLFRHGYHRHWLI